MARDQAFALVILDGWGIAKDPTVSAIDNADTPFVDGLFERYPHTRLHASGKAVGLPEGQMGNSEVGHMNLGAGRLVYQDLERINKAVKDGSLADNETLKKALDLAAEPGRKLHFIGLVSDGGVHSHIDHLKGLLDIAASRGLEDVFIHAFTDGRDCDPKSGSSFLRDLEDHSRRTTGRIASVVGRYYAMDRDKRWERLKEAYDLLVHGKGEKFENPVDAIEASYAAGVTDEFVKPAIIAPEGETATINDGDVVICFNFRTDRGRQISMALSQCDFPDYGMEKKDIRYFTMTPYDDTFEGVEVFFRKQIIANTLGEWLEKKGKTQIRIAETEKYPHVTFFFSGGREVEFKGERRILCPSPKVATYDLQPEMSAFEVRDKIVPELKERSADFVCLNFANPDMVGHTGSMQAAIKACETVDECTRDVVEAALEGGYELIILADHGNADCMQNPDGSPNTAHSTEPVPCFLVSSEFEGKLREGVLGDVAPTILERMGIEKPKEMTGKSLIES